MDGRDLDDLVAGAEARRLRVEHHEPFPEELREPALRVVRAAGRAFRLAEEGAGRAACRPGAAPGDAEVVGRPARRRGRRGRRGRRWLAHGSRPGVALEAPRLARAVQGFQAGRAAQQPGGLAEPREAPLGQLGLGAQVAWRLRAVLEDRQLRRRAVVRATHAVSVPKRVMVAGQRGCTVAPLSSGARLPDGAPLGAAPHGGPRPRTGLRTRPTFTSKRLEKCRLRGSVVVKVRP